MKEKPKIIKPVRFDPKIIKQVSKKKVSFSEYVREAVLEKLERDKKSQSLKLGA